MGWRRACQVLTLAGVVPDPPGVEEAATGRYHVSCAGTGELPHAQPTAIGPENARVRAGGRRRRSSQRPCGHHGDRVKDRQAWCTGTTWHTRTWGMFTHGSPRATSDLMASAGSLRRRAVSKHHAGKRSASKDARSVWRGGKTVKSYLSLPARDTRSRNGYYVSIPSPITQG